MVRRLSLILSFALGLVALPGPADAAWPGSNGHIVYRALVPGFEAEGSEPTGLAWTSGRPGSSSHTLTSNPTDIDPQVSPDGRLIAFSRQVEPQQESSAVHHGIFTIRFDGSGLRQLTAPPEECADGRATFNPSGSRLFFIRHCRGPARGTDTWRVDIGGGEPERLQGRASRGGASVFSPTGRQVVFIRRSDDGPHLISMRPNGRRRRDLHPQLRSIEGPLDFSPSGRLIIFSGGESTDLFTVSANGHRLRRFSGLHVEPGGRPPDYAEPAYSPDGKQVVAIARGRSGPASLVRFEVGGDGRGKGVPGVRYGDMPVWAPSTERR
jgi:Tol biopolymer transport system component